MTRHRNRFGFPIGRPDRDLTVTTDRDGIVTVDHPGYTAPIVTASAPGGEDVTTTATSASATSLLATTSPLVEIDGVLVQAAPEPAAGVTVHVHIREGST